MASLVYPRGFASSYTTIFDSVVGLVDLGFDSDDLLSADVAHISVVGDGSLRYFYDGTVPQRDTGHVG